MIRAAALSYAIVFALLIGLICSSIIFITGVQKKIEVIQTNKEYLLLDSYAAIQYGKLNVAIGDSAQLIHTSGDTSTIFHKLWGGISLITANTRKGNIVKQRIAFIGNELNKDLPALYLPGNTGELKLSGDTKIKGNINVPNKKVEAGYLSGKFFSNPKLVEGDIREAENFLPPLNTSFINLMPLDFTKGIKSKKYIAKDSLYSFFENATYFQEIEAITIENKIKGQIIIHSFDSIFVRKNASLENVILIAPRVRFEEGFEGTVQVLANESVVLEADVHLDYPSFVVLNEQKTKNELTRRTVFIGERAKVLGGILITSQELDFRRYPLLYLKSQALVGGMVYNCGASEIKGAVIGGFYTSQLELHYGGAEYQNYLLDATLFGNKLPEHFCVPNWLKELKREKSRVIKWQ